MLLGLGSCSSPGVEEIATTAAATVTVEVAQPTTIDGVLTVTGTVVPAPGAEWTIVAPEPARIAELPKAEGDAVKTGDLLVRYDIPSRPADLAARRAEAAQATARLTTARAAVVRLSGLVDRGVAAPREVEEARRDQAEAEAALAQAESAVKAVEALGERAVVRATFSGAVAKRWHQPGDLVDASASDPILRVIDPGRLQVIASVPVAELTHLAVGRSAKVARPDGGEGLAARIVSMPIAIEVDRPTADVRLTMSEPLRLPAGAPVDVELTTATHTKAIVIPRSAIGREDDEAFVLVAGADNKAHRQKVDLGIVSRDRVEVVAGVSAGDRIIVRGQEGLPDGAAITIAK